MSVYKNLKGCEKIDGVFITDQEINAPTLLITAKYTTHSRLLRFFRLSSILPITHFVRLRLFFKNLYDSEISEKKNVKCWIEYPDGKQYRPWQINIPRLISKNNCFWSEIDILFKPEVPGIHRFIIEKCEGIQYADFHGMTGRPYKQIENEWKSSFNIHTSLELGSYVVAILALIIALLSLFVPIAEPCGFG
jgi:hypothetical protein